VGKLDPDVGITHFRAKNSMKTQLTVKLLHHQGVGNKEEGFTLIELLVVVIIIGILSATAMPSFLSQAAKTRQSEAKNSTGALNRAQQAYYLENQIFADDVTKLSVGVVNSDNYNYAVTGNDLINQVAHLATAQQADLKSYAGGVFKSVNNQTTQAILCEANSAGNAPINAPTSSNTCANGSQRLQ